MSSSFSIPIQARHANNQQTIPCESTLATSLPARANRTFHQPSTRHRPASLLSSQDDLATISWPPRPSVELVSRSARKFEAHATHRSSLLSDSGKNARDFQPWDFSGLVTATDKVRTAFETGCARAERPPREGVSGTYFFRRNESKADVLGVFKPVDEEAADIDMSPTILPQTHASYPNSFSGDADFSLGPAHGTSSPLAHSPLVSSFPFHRTGSLSSESEFDSRFYRASGFHVGEGAYKEVAAYLLDHYNFAKVPQTALAKCNFTSDTSEKDHYDSGSPGPSFVSDSGDATESDEEGHIPTSETEQESHLRTKMGAFQVYCHNVGDADDFGPGVFDKDQVHRIAILDIRTLNHDRHGGNILVTKSTSMDRRFDLVPIDHGFILPEVVRSIPWPVWMDWPMAREPLSDSSKRYIERLDPDSESHILEEELDGKLRSGSLQGLQIATRVLQKGVALGMTLYEIGLLMYTRRDEPGVKSELEKIMVEADEMNKSRDRGIFDNDTTGMPRDHYHHRRHQSMTSFQTNEALIDDFVVRYATRRMYDIMYGVAARKENQRRLSPSAPPRLSRARSIPDFGIGIKPLHALMTNDGDSAVPANTPVASPVSDSARGVDVMSSLEAQISRASDAIPRRAPIQIPINSSIQRIAIPEPRPTPHPSVGSMSGHAVAMVMGGNRSGSQMGERNAPNGLPPLFKPREGKSSPVAPLDVLSWDTRSS